MCSSRIMPFVLATELPQPEWFCHCLRISTWIKAWPLSASKREMIVTASGSFLGTGYKLASILKDTLVPRNARKFLCFVLTFYFLAPLSPNFLYYTTARKSGWTFSSIICPKIPSIINLQLLRKFWPHCFISIFLRCHYCSSHLISLALFLCHS